MDRSDSPRVSLDIAEKINQLYKRLNNDPKSWIGILSAKIYQHERGIYCVPIGTGEMPFGVYSHACMILIGTRFIK